MTVKIPRTLLLTLLSSATLNCNARNNLIPKHVADERRCQDANGFLVRPDIHKITRDPNELEIMHESGEPVYLSQLQLRAQYTETKPALDLALETQTQLAELQCEPTSCTANSFQCVKCVSTYCMTNIDLVNEHPEKYSDFMTVIDTDHCRVQPKSFGLTELYTKVMEYDSRDDVNTFSLPVKIGIFEMGHTDSDRLTKAIAIDHTNMILVNAQPLNEALMQCDDKRKQLLSPSSQLCDRTKVVELVRKVAYLACRTTHISYQKCIIKFPPLSTQAIDIFELAFPDADTYFIYHEPETLLGGTFTNPEYPERAACAKLKRQPSKAVASEARDMGKNSKDMSIEELCSLETRVEMKKALNQKMNTNRLKFVHADKVLENLGRFSDNFLGSANDAMRIIGNTDQFGNVDNEKYASSKKAKHDRVNEKMETAANELLKNLYLTMAEKDESNVQV